jgi:hypothetical protein
MDKKIHFFEKKIKLQKIYLVVFIIFDMLSLYSTAEYVAIVWFMTQQHYILYVCEFHCSHVTVLKWYDVKFIVF